MEDGNTEWLVNYLKLAKAYIQPRVSFEDLDTLNLCTPNAKCQKDPKFIKNKQCEGLRGFSIW